MTIEEIRAYLEENKDSEEVKQLFGDYKQISVQDVEDLTQSDKDLKSWLDSQKDRHFSKGLETWKQNNLESFITEKYNELNPVKSPHEIEIENLKKQFAEVEREKLHETLKNKALTVATEKGLPTSSVKFFLGEDEASTLQNLETYENDLRGYGQKMVEKTMKKNEYQPPSTLHNSSGGTPAMAKFLAMNYKEKVKLRQENPTAYDDLVGKQ